MPDPPPPVAPEVIVRGDNGRVIVRATRLTTPLTMDGVLDEEVYTQVKSMSDFIQTVPNEGAPATERTEAWVTYDDNNFYLSCRCWDSAPPEEWTANELRRDTNQLRQNDMFGALLDTFHDRRNGFNFYTNPLGARADQVVTNEGNPNADWNPVWFVRTGRFDGGWTVEMAIPFKSIRYVSGTDQEWGLQIRRAIRRKNEWTHLTFVPAATGGVTSIFRASAAATLVGLDLPPASKNVELKPYGISKLTTDKLRSPQLVNDLDATAGLDAKYGINANMTADLTINTDFAQVEVDEQQVNLTRFPVVFPEKRDFFLEGRGTFEFARASGQAGFSGQTSISNNAPQLFFTRRIGLNNAREVPIIAGGRLSGTLGKTAVGAMNMETGYESLTDIEPDNCGAPYAACTPRTNFTVLRARRDILRRSNIGVIFTNRSDSPTVATSNQAYGVDAAFSFFQNVTANAYYARSESQNRDGDEGSYQGKVDYSGDRWGARLDYLDVGANYYPEIGFVQRRGFGRTLRGRPLQPADAEQQSGAALPRRRRGRVCRQPRPQHRVQPEHGALPDRVPEQRPVRVRLQQQLRAAAEAVRGVAGRGDSPGRIPFQQRHHQLRLRTTAAHVRNGGAAGRPVLRRPHPGSDDQRRAGGADETVLAGAECHLQPGDVAGRRLHEHAASDPGRLRVLAADVPQRAAAVRFGGASL